MDSSGDPPDGRKRASIHRQRNRTRRALARFTLARHLHDEVQIHCCRRQTGPSPPSAEHFKPNPRRYDSHRCLSGSRPVDQQGQQWGSRFVHGGQVSGVVGSLKPATPAPGRTPRIGPCSRQRIASGRSPFMAHVVGKGRWHWLLPIGTGGARARSRVRHQSRVGIAVKGGLASPPLCRSELLPEWLVLSPESKVGWSRFFRKA